MTITHKSALRIRNKFGITSNDGVGTVTDDTEYQYDVEYADGNASNQAQDTIVVNATVLSNDYQTYDLAGGVTDRFGNTITFLKVKEITICNKSTTAGEDIVFGGQAATGGNLISTLFNGATTAGITIRAGGIMVWADPLTGITITGGTADVLMIGNEGTGPIEFDLIIKGTRT